MDTTAKQYELGFLGAGNMAEAIAKAAIEQGVLRREQVIASDPNEERQSAFKQLGITTCDDNTMVIQSSKQIMVAVKPQIMKQVAADLGKHGSEQQVILSIMAGVSTEQLGQIIAAQHSVDRPRVIRIMPNLPIQVGLGMAGVALGPHAKGGDEALAMRLFEAAGKVVLVDESKLDAITAVSGSGPAYVFYLAEAIQSAACELGLNDHAAVLAQQTILGAAHLMAASDDDPGTLRRKVTSPGGTTEAAIEHLQQNKTSDIITGAIHAAAKRSVELGQ